MSLTPFRVVVSIVVLSTLAAISLAETSSFPLAFWSSYPTNQDLDVGTILAPSMMTAGTCDTAGPIEIESSGGTTTPTAYATLTAAFAAINAGTHTGTITIDVCGNTDEGVGTATLSASGSASASYTSLTMSPAGGAPRTISGATTAGSPMIDFSGADNVTINGLNSGGNSLTISNTTASATSGTSTVRFIGGATGNTITNSNLQGSVSSSVATNGAVVFFSTDAVTANGNDNNTISNNNIGPAGANLPTKAILGNGSTTTTAIGNSGIVINNNNIFDFFGPAVTSSGIATNGGCNTWTITNNRLYQTATRTWTTGAAHIGIDIRPATGTSGAQGMTVTGNVIGYASNTQTGTYALTGAGTGAKFLGILFNGISTGATTNINNNTVAAVSMTGVTSSGTSTATPFTGILFQEGNGITNGNTIGSQSSTGSLTFSTTTTSSADVYGIYNFSSNAWTSNTNNIGGISVTNLGASGTFLLYGMRAFTAGTTTWSGTSNVIGGTVANSIQLNGTGVASQVVGMFTSNCPLLLTSNTIRNLTTNIGSGLGASSSVIGISNSSSTPNSTLSQNTIFNLSNTNATAASTVAGIHLSGSTTNLVERNLVHSLTVATNSISAEVSGFRNGAGNTTYRNNIIAIGAGIPNAIGGAVTNGSTIGINGILDSAGGNNYFHNSVYVGGSPTAGSGASFAFNGAVTTNTRSFRDNIFFNARSNSGATGKNYVIKINGTAPNPTGLTLNNNVYFANGTGGVFGFFNSADVSDLNAWKALVGLDAGSFESNPQYLDPTNATPNLHLNPVASTVAEGNGADVGVTDDFDGQTRASLTPVDIGADAGNFAGVDLSAPAISYTPLVNTALTTNRILSVTLTDASGVATGGLAPRIYFNKNAGAYFSTACALSSGTVNNGTWNCTIDNALIGGVVGADVVRYFVVAQDTTGNLAANPSAGFSGSNVNSVTSPPTTPNQYVIAVPFTGSYNVGTGQTFTSLTNVGGIFEAINNGSLTGNVTINITSDLTSETGAVALNEFAEDGVGGYTLLIKPSGGPRSISGSNAGALIRLNGADRVRFDGSTAASLTGKVETVVGGNPALRELTIQNTNVGTSTVVLAIGSNAANGAQNNTIKNVNILGQDPLTTLGGITLGGATPGTAATGPNNGNRVENCSVKRTIYGIYSAGQSAASPNTGTVITQNESSAIVGDRIRRVGIVVFNDNGVQVTENSLNGISTNEGFDGVAIGIGLQALDNTAATAGGVTNAVVERNKINGVASLSATGFSAAGIGVAGSPGGPNTVRNNMITGVTSPATSPDLVAGIYIAGVTGSVTRAYHNSVAMTGDRGAVASQMPSFGIAVTGADPTVELKNNIFYTTQTSGGGANAKSYAIGMVSTTFANLDSNYNDFFSSGANAGFFRTGSLAAGAGTDHATLAAWQAAVSDDANSQELDPVFIDPLSDLHLNSGTSPLLGDGITGFATNDIDGETRDVPPDIGADEIVTVVPGTVQFSSATYSVGEAGPQATLTVTRTGGDDGAVSVNYSLGGGTATGGGSCVGPVDYVNTAGSVNFADGDAADKTFNVSICDDNVFEGNETFVATLSIGSGGATLGTPNPATVTITENDVQPIIQFAFLTSATSEANPTAVISVTRQGALGNAIGVSYADVGTGTATGGASCAAGVDYIIPAGTLSWAANDATFKSFNVSICNDAIPEANETVSLVLSNPTGGAVLGAQSTQPLTIINDDAADTTAPVITYSPISSNPGSTSLSATITDTIGVTAANIFWSINGAPFTSAPCSMSGGTAQNGTWNCVITGAPNPAAVAYYVTASDAAANTGSNPSSGASAPNLFTIGAATVPAGSYTNLNLGNGVVLGGNVDVALTLTLTGVTNTGANTLTLGCNASTIGGGELNYVVGDLQKVFCGTGTFVFHVGAAFPVLPPIASEETKDLASPEGIASNYSPVTVDILAGDVGSSLTVKAYDSALAGFDPARSASRNWAITESGNLTVNLGLTYRNEDVNGNEADYRAYRYGSGPTTNMCPSAPCVNVATNTATINNVSVFSRWGIAESLVPTAANVTLSGRVVDTAGRGISNAILTLEGGNLTDPIVMASGSMGYYTFDGVPIGTYLLTISGTRYTFAVPSRVVMLADSVTDEDFVGEPRE
ncbi:MAG TPA: Calx-beta domain-containing protein [Pyrinomonadaceae bacterium]|nr:Calx-beta domain-containing protein [Pyrinomonadaceae bacterium]